MNKEKEKGKAVVTEPKILFGRPGNNLKMGIVGLPNVGKSTLFNILTKMNVPAENYPFCTINPSESRVAVPDERFDFLVDKFKPASKVSAFLTVIDIAGLVRGASKGEGLGNAFLSHIKAVDGIYHVVRIFEDEEIIHVEGNIDPVRDLQIISEELIAKDLELLTNEISELEKIIQRVDKTRKGDLDIIKKAYDMIAAGKEIRFGDWKPAEIEILNKVLLLTAKPVVYLVNMTAADYINKKNKWLIKIKQWVEARQLEPIIPFCGQLEAKLMDGVTAGDAASATSAIPRIIKTGYHALDLIYYFTSGSDEVKAWTLRRGTKAPQAAGIIHTDFEKGFICAEVMRFEDFKEHGSETVVKAAGKYQQQGKNYTVEDGDIIFFKFNTSSSSGKKK